MNPVDTQVLYLDINNEDDNLDNIKKWRKEFGDLNQLSSSKSPAPFILTQMCIGNKFPEGRILLLKSITDMISSPKIALENKILSFQALTVKIIKAKGAYFPSDVTLVLEHFHDVMDKFAQIVPNKLSVRGHPLNFSISPLGRVSFTGTNLKNLEEVALYAQLIYEAYNTILEYTKRIPGTASILKKYVKVSFKVFQVLESFKQEHVSTTKTFILSRISHCQIRLLDFLYIVHKTNPDIDLRVLADNYVTLINRLPYDDTNEMITAFQAFSNLFNVLPADVVQSVFLDEDKKKKILNAQIFTVSTNIRSKILIQVKNFVTWSSIRKALKLGILKPRGDSDTIQNLLYKYLLNKVFDSKLIQGFSSLVIKSYEVFKQQNQLEAIRSSVDYLELFLYFRLKNISITVQLDGIDQEAKDSVVKSCVELTELASKIVADEKRTLTVSFVLIIKLLIEIISLAREHGCQAKTRNLLIQRFAKLLHKMRPEIRSRLIGIFIPDLFEIILADESSNELLQPLSGYTEEFLDFFLAKRNQFKSRKNLYSVIKNIFNLMDKRSFAKYVHRIFITLLSMVHESPSHHVYGVLSILEALVITKGVEGPLREYVDENIESLINVFSTLTSQYTHTLLRISIGLIIISLPISDMTFIEHKDFFLMTMLYLLEHARPHTFPKTLEFVLRKLRIICQRQNKVPSKPEMMVIKALHRISKDEYWMECKTPISKKIEIMHILDFYKLNVEETKLEKGDMFGFDRVDLVYHFDGFAPPIEMTLTMVDISHKLIGHKTADSQEFKRQMAFVSEVVENVVHKVSTNPEAIKIINKSRKFLMLFNAFSHGSKLQGTDERGFELFLEVMENEETDIDLWIAAVARGWFRAFWPRFRDWAVKNADRLRDPILSVYENFLFWGVDPSRLFMPYIQLSLEIANKSNFPRYMKSIFFTLMSIDTNGSVETAIKKFVELAMSCDLSKELAELALKDISRSLSDDIQSQLLVLNALPLEVVQEQLVKRLERIRDSDSYYIRFLARVHPFIDHYDSSDVLSKINNLLARKEFTSYCISFMKESTMLNDVSFVDSVLIMELVKRVGVFADAQFVLRRILAQGYQVSYTLMRKIITYCIDSAPRQELTKILELFTEFLDEDSARRIFDHAKECRMSAECIGIVYYLYSHTLISFEDFFDTFCVGPGVDVLPQIEFVFNDDRLANRLFREYFPSRMHLFFNDTFRRIFRADPARFLGPPETSNLNYEAFSFVLENLGLEALAYCPTATLPEKPMIDLLTKRWKVVSKVNELKKDKTQYDLILGILEEAVEVPEYTWTTISYDFKKTLYELYDKDELLDLMNFLVDEVGNPEVSYPSRLRMLNYIISPILKDGVYDFSEFILPLYEIFDAQCLYAYSRELSAQNFFYTDLLDLISHLLLNCELDDPDIVQSFLDSLEDRMRNFVNFNFTLIAVETAAKLSDGSQDWDRSRFLTIFTTFVKFNPQYIEDLPRLVSQIIETFGTGIIYECVLIVSSYLNVSESSHILHAFFMQVGLCTLDEYRRLILFLNSYITMLSMSVGNDSINNFTNIVQLVLDIESKRKASGETGIIHNTFLCNICVSLCRINDKNVRVLWDKIFEIHEDIPNVRIVVDSLPPKKPNYLYVLSKIASRWPKVPFPVIEDEDREDYAHIARLIVSTEDTPKKEQYVKSFFSKVSDNLAGLDWVKEDLTPEFSSLEIISERHTEVVDFNLTNIYEGLVRLIDSKENTETVLTNLEWALKFLQQRLSVHAGLRRICLNDLIRILSFLDENKESQNRLIQLLISYFSMWISDSDVPKTEKVKILSALVTSKLTKSSDHICTTILGIEDVDLRNQYLFYTLKTDSPNLRKIGQDLMRSNLQDRNVSEFLLDLMVSIDHIFISEDWVHLFPDLFLTIFSVSKDQQMVYHVAKDCPIPQSAFNDTEFVSCPSHTDLEYFQYIHQAENCYFPPVLGALFDSLTLEQNAMLLDHFTEILYLKQSRRDSIELLVNSFSYSNTYNLLLPPTILEGISQTARVYEFIILRYIVRCLESFDHKVNVFSSYGSPEHTRSAYISLATRMCIDRGYDSLAAGLLTMDSNRRLFNTAINEYLSRNYEETYRYLIESVSTEDFDETGSVSYLLYRVAGEIENYDVLMQYSEYDKSVPMKVKLATDPQQFSSLDLAESVGDPLFASMRGLDSLSEVQEEFVRIYERLPDRLDESKIRFMLSSFQEVKQMLLWRDFGVYYSKVEREKSLKKVGFQRLLKFLQKHRQSPKKIFRAVPANPRWSSFDYKVLMGIKRFYLGSSLSSDGYEYNLIKMVRKRNLKNLSLWYIDALLPRMLIKDGLSFGETLEVLRAFRDFDPEGGRRMFPHLNVETEYQEAIVKSTMAEIHVRQGDYERAFEMWKEVTEKSPTHSKGWRGLFLMLEEVLNDAIIRGSIRADVDEMRSQLLHSYAMSLINTDYSHHCHEVAISGILLHLGRMAASPPLGVLLKIPYKMWTRWIDELLSYAVNSGDRDFSAVVERVYGVSKTLMDFSAAFNFGGHRLRFLSERKNKLVRFLSRDDKILRLDPFRSVVVIPELLLGRQEIVADDRIYAAYKNSGDKARVRIVSLSGEAFHYAIQTQDRRLYNQRSRVSKVLFVLNSVIERRMRRVPDAPFFQLPFEIGVCSAPGSATEGIVLRSQPLTAGMTPVKHLAEGQLGEDVWDRAREYWDKSPKDLESYTHVSTEIVRDDVLGYHAKAHNTRARNYISYQNNFASTLSHSLFFNTVFSSSKALQDPVMLVDGHILRNGAVLGLLNPGVGYGGDLPDHFNISLGVEKLLGRGLLYGYVSKVFKNCLDSLFGWRSRLGLKILLRNTNDEVALVEPLAGAGQARRRRAMGIREERRVAEENDARYAEMLRMAESLGDTDAPRGRLLGMLDASLDREWVVPRIKDEEFPWILI